MFNFNEEHRLLFCFQPKVNYLMFYSIGNFILMKTPLTYYDPSCRFPGWVKYMVELFHKLGFQVGGKFRACKSVER